MESIVESAVDIISKQIAVAKQKFMSRRDFVGLLAKSGTALYLEQNGLAKVVSYYLPGDPRLWGVTEKERMIIASWVPRGMWTGLDTKVVSFYGMERWGHNKRAASLELEAVKHILRPFDTSENVDTIMGKLKPRATPRMKFNGLLDELSCGIGERVFGKKRFNKFLYSSSKPAPKFTQAKLSENKPENGNNTASSQAQQTQAPGSILFGNPFKFSPGICDLFYINDTFSPVSKLFREASTGEKQFFSAEGSDADFDGADFDIAKSISLIAEAASVLRPAADFIESHFHEKNSKNFALYSVVSAQISTGFLEEAEEKMGRIDDVLYI